MRDEAIKQKKSLVEASHYQYHPLAFRIREIIASGEIGAIKHVSSEFSIASYLSFFASEAKSTDIRFQYNLGGGITMVTFFIFQFIETIGCRILSNKVPTIKYLTISVLFVLLLDLNQK